VFDAGVMLFAVHVVSSVIDVPDEVQLKHNSFSQINVAQPLTISSTSTSSGTSITLDTTWTANSITPASNTSGITTIASGTDTLQLSLNDSFKFTDLKIQNKIAVCRTTSNCKRVSRDIEKK
jgi:hypothetical protein